MQTRIARAVVHVDDFARLGQRQAESLGAQRKLEARAVACAVDTAAPTRPGALRLQQTHVFVKPDRPRGQVKLFGKVADGVLGGGHGGR